jgi:hypothetical protein
MSETHPGSTTIRYDVDDRTVTETVAQAVANARGVDVLDLPPLGDVVDAGALERLCHRSGQHSTSDVLVSFSYEGCQVRVEGETVSVTGPDDAGD